MLANPGVDGLNLAQGAQAEDLLSNAGDYTPVFAGCAETPTKSSSNNRMSPTLSSGSGSQDQFGDRQFVVFTSEKQSRVVALPSHNCVYRQQLADVDFVVKAEIISLKDSVCLVCYSSNGHITAYSLPSLRPLIDYDFLPLTDQSLRMSYLCDLNGSVHGWLVQRTAPGHLLCRLNTQFFMHEMFVMLAEHTALYA
uniref:Lethal giant larvae (Lgl)-like C-terminal domain-containing protein n=1 Tax=Timema genevievae TaxID=629358 RepID=A0A7R9JXE6_TIMGE|nr:unnamed protein product [Timema genevievae]